jgi:hypothetical protein
MTISTSRAELPLIINFAKQSLVGPIWSDRKSRRLKDLDPPWLGLSVSAYSTHRTGVSEPCEIAEVIEKGVEPSDLCCEQAEGFWR